MNRGLDLSNVEFFPDGSIRSGSPREECFFDTKYGKFKAQYRNDGPRKQTISSLEFFENGSLRKLSLEEQMTVNTLHGEIPAELILFYDSKNIRKIFPLNGKVTGFWSAKDEFNLAEELEFTVNRTVFKGKFVNVEFYEDQSVKSLLLWPNENIEIELNNKKVKVKNKISFYRNGNIKTIEPVTSLILNTPIGDINVVNPDSSGFGYDSTIKFSEDGTIKQLQTSSDKFEIMKDSSLISSIEPELRVSMCNDNIFIPQVIKIKFENETVSFDNVSYEIAPHEFLIYNNAVRVTNISCCG